MVFWAPKLVIRRKVEHLGVLTATLLTTPQGAEVLGALDLRKLEPFAVKDTILYTIYHILHTVFQVRLLHTVFYILYTVYVAPVQAVQTRLLVVRPDGGNEPQPAVLE